VTSPPFPRRLFPRIEPGEGRALAWSFACFFFLLAGYYVLRPVRETMGISRGTGNLPWLFLAVFVGMLVAVPVYSTLVSRFSRRTFVPVVYHFFALNLLGFYGALRFLPQEYRVEIGYAYYVWLSVFNLFVVSVFWSFMADLFRERQGARLFGFISAGGTLGALCGSLLTTQVIRIISTVDLFLVAILLLEASGVGVYGMGRAGRSSAGALRAAEGPTGGGIWAGFTATFRSPFLLGISGYMILGSLCGTFVYMTQASLIEQSTLDEDRRTELFAWINVAVQALTLLVQACATHRLIARLGVGLTLSILPLVFLLCFSAFGMVPVLGALIAFQAVSRAARYSVAKPTKELLFTVVTREEKYKAKSFIDTVVRRGGDVGPSFAFEGLYAGLGWSLTILSFASVPLCVLWIALAHFLGRRHGELRGSVPPGEAIGADRDRGPAGLACRFPSHTTGHTGPYHGGSKS